MSRSRNKCDKIYNRGLRLAKLYSNQHRRAYKKRLINALKKSKDTDDIELPFDCKKNSNKGDIWHWD